MMNGCRWGGGDHGTVCLELYSWIWWMVAEEEEEEKKKEQSWCSSFPSFLSHLWPRHWRMVIATRSTEDGTKTWTILQYPPFSLSHPWPRHWLKVISVASTFVSFHRRSFHSLKVCYCNREPRLKCPSDTISVISGATTNPFPSPILRSTWRDTRCREGREADSRITVFSTDRPTLDRGGGTERDFYGAWCEGSRGGVVKKMWSEQSWNAYQTHQSMMYKMYEDLLKTTTDHRCVLQRGGETFMGWKSPIWRIWKHLFQSPPLQDHSICWRKNMKTYTVSLITGTPGLLLMVAGMVVEPKLCWKGQNRLLDFWRLRKSVCMEDLPLSPSIYMQHGESGWSVLAGLPQTNNWLLQ